jgi:hypothetical protein
LKTKFKPGDWILAAGGIGQVVSCEPLFVEEFYLKEGQSVGDLEKVDVFFKLLCDFEGKLRKRNRFEVVREEYCKKIRAQDMKLIEKIKSSSPHEFAKFEAASETIGLVNGLEYKIPEEQLELTIHRLQEAIKTLPVPFTYPEFVEACKIEGLNLIEKRAAPVDRNLTIQLYNEWGKTREKRRLFTRARAIKVEPAI